MAKSPRPTLTITGQRLQEIESGFFAMKEKRLPNGDTEALVVSMYQLIRPACEAYRETLQLINADLRKAELIEDSDEKTAEFLRCQDRLTELNAHTYTIPAPRSRLTQVHLPKPYKSRDGSGEMNTAGNAGIMIALGAEFFVMPTEPASEEEESSEEEGSPHE